MSVKRTRNTRLQEEWSGEHARASLEAREAFELASSRTSALRLGISAARVLAALVKSSSSSSCSAAARPKNK